MLRYIPTPHECKRVLSLEPCSVQQVFVYGGILIRWHDPRANVVNLNMAGRVGDPVHHPRPVLRDVGGFEGLQLCTIDEWKKALGNYTNVPFTFARTEDGKMAFQNPYLWESMFPADAKKEWQAKYVIVVEKRPPTQKVRTMRSDPSVKTNEVWLPLIVPVTWLNPFKNTFVFPTPEAFTMLYGKEADRCSNCRSYEHHDIEADFERFKLPAADPHLFREYDMYEFADSVFGVCKFSAKFTSSC